eukprot:7803927-Lingulodinium_polyedra.AAC.1
MPCCHCQCQPYHHHHQEIQWHHPITVTSLAILLQSWLSLWRYSDTILVKHLSLCSMEAISDCDAGVRLIASVEAAGAAHLVNASTGETAFVAKN